MMSARQRALGAGLMGVAVLATLLGSPASATPTSGPPTSKPTYARPAQPDPRLLAAERAADRGAPPAESRAALAALQKRISGYVNQHGTGYDFGSYLDARGEIVLETDAPAAVIDRLTTTVKGARPLVRKTAIADNYSRNDDIAPFYGGGGLTGGAATAIGCTAGYAVRNAAGTRFLTTAGHCFTNGTLVRNGTRTQVVGTVQGASTTTVDSSLIGGRTYAGRIFIGAGNSAASAPVVSAGAATVGYNNYCHSGARTGEQCGHIATSTTAQICTMTGCKSPVITYTGGVLHQAGDSGAPFYAKDSAGAVYIRGHVIAASSTTGYVQRWDTVSTRYGVAIVTG